MGKDQRNGNFARSKVPLKRAAGDLFAAKGREVRGGRGKSEILSRKIGGKGRSSASVDGKKRMEVGGLISQMPFRWV